MVLNGVTNGFDIAALLKYIGGVQANFVLTPAGTVAAVTFNCMVLPIQAAVSIRLLSGLGKTITVTVSLFLSQ